MLSTTESLEKSPGKPGRNDKWYVLKTKPRAERQVAILLESWHFAVYLPLLRRRHLCEPLFPGYLFLKIDCGTDEYLRSRSAPGVSYIISADGVPVPITGALIEEIMARVDRENSLSPAERFMPGDRLVITAGPFRDLEAVFDRTLTARGRCLILLKILGRLARVQVDAEYLVKAKN